MTRALLGVLLLLSLATPARAAEHVIAVAYFDANAVDPTLEPLGRGVSDMLMTDLARGRGVRIVERARLAEVIAELELQRSQYIDEATAQELGRGLGATLVVVGALTSALEGMRLDARVVDVERGEVRLAVEATGRSDEFFALERELAARILDGLGVVWDEAALVERDELSLDDVLSYARRIDEQDQRALERLDALSVYKTRRLRRDTLSYTTGSGSGGNTTVSTTVTWAVYDGGGRLHTATSFADLVGDTDGQARIRRRTHSSLGVGFAGIGVGVGVMIAGFATVEQSYDLQYGSPRYRRYHDGGMAVAIIGIVTAIATPTVAFQIARLSTFVSAFYTPEQADDWIRRHNDAVGEELGLDPADLRRMDVQSRRGPRVEMELWVALGWVGVSGRF